MNPHSDGDEDLNVLDSLHDNDTRPRAAQAPLKVPVRLPGVVLVGVVVVIVVGLVLVTGLTRHHHSSAPVTAPSDEASASNQNACQSYTAIPDVTVSTSRSAIMGVVGRIDAVQVGASTEPWVASVWHNQAGLYSALALILGRGNKTAVQKARAEAIAGLKSADAACKTTGAHKGAVGT